MTLRLHRYELPARFLEQFRPVKAHSREKGLPGFLFDAYGLRFYRHLTTAGEVPAEAVWSVTRKPGGLTLTHGFIEHAAGYVIAQALPAAGHSDSYLLPVRLGYRAKVAVQALQQLRGDLMRAATLNATDALAVIDRRIDAYHHPKTA